MSHGSGTKPAARKPKTPRALGFSMPAEWAEHEAVWLAWPHDRESFPNLESVERSYAAVARALQDSGSEPIRLLVTGPALRERAARVLREGGGEPDRVRFYELPYADVWIRDYGPIFVADGKKDGLAMTRWLFNAWGGKYAELMGDTRVPGDILVAHPMPCFETGIVLEGGSIEVNGRGCLLTTEQCLLNPNRNPGLGRARIEAVLRDYLGAERVIWLKEGVEGDDTDGHIDDIARFTSGDSVVCAFAEDPAHPDHAALKENYELLRAARDQEGRPLRVAKLPVPGPVRRKDGSPLPASYANFYVANKAVLVPAFGHANDARAQAVLREHFPGRAVVGIDAGDWVHGLGTLHCSSQQQPKV